MLALSDSGDLGALGSAPGKSLAHVSVRLQYYVSDMSLWQPHVSQFIHGDVIKQHQLTSNSLDSLNIFPLPSMRVSVAFIVGLTGAAYAIPTKGPSLIVQQIDVAYNGAAFVNESLPYLM